MNTQPVTEQALIRGGNFAPTLNKSRGHLLQEPSTTNTTSTTTTTTNTTATTTINGKLPPGDFFSFLFSCVLLF